MLFLPKRKIVSMMREVFPRMRKRDRRKLAKQLDNPENNKAIEATWELAATWSLLVIAKELGVRKAGVTAESDVKIDIGLPKSIVIEITAPSGDTFEFKVKLETSTKKIFALCNRISGGAGDYMSVRYHEWRGPKKNVPRIPAIVENVDENPEFIAWLTLFINDDTRKRARINLPNVISADFEKIDHKYPRLNFSCSIPNNPQSIHNNLSKALINKIGQQLSPFQSDHFVGLVVCDGGNQVISDPLKPGGYGTVSGEEIMSYIISETDVDFIACLGRKDEMDMTGIIISPLNTVKNLSFHMFTNPKIPQTTAEEIYAALGNAFSKLPVPLLHPYQSKNLQEQDFRRGAGKAYYLPPSISHERGGPMKVRISARALFELISGQIDGREFQTDSHGIFSKIPRLNQKHISDVSLESSSDGRDDDYVVFDFSDDVTTKKFIEIEKEI